MQESKTTHLRRKVIQLTGNARSMVALCDDGKMFSAVEGYAGWIPLMDVPQPKRKSCKKKQ